MAIASDMDPELKARLEQSGQTGVLRFWDRLTPDERTRLVDQLSELDLDQLGRLVKDPSSEVDHHDRASRAVPPPAFRTDRSRNRFSREQALAAGIPALSAGKVGMILVAGGQGTRLGFDRPKGMFNIGPVSNRPLFQVIIDHLRARADQFGVEIPLYLMTSPATHDDTVAYLSEKNGFGLEERNLRYFCQGTMPAVDLDSGQLLLEKPDQLALSPDGHGGMLAALEKTGCLADAEQRGIEYLFYAQVDNPLVQVCDPELIGYHILSESEMTTQVVRKSDPLERVGNVVEVDGRVQIIEYSDLPDEYALQQDDEGQPKLWAGNIAVHVFDVAFLRRMVDDADALPFHRAKKKVPHLDQGGSLVEPAEPNACKFERFIFDLLPSARNAIVVEAEKSEAFAPVKNADGQPSDTPEHARRAIVELHKRWLAECGITVPDGVLVEIDPKLAVDLDQLREKKDRLANITTDTYLTEK